MTEEQNQKTYKKLFYLYIKENKSYLDHLYKSAIEHLSNFIENEMQKHEDGNETANMFLLDILNTINIFLINNDALYNISMLEEFYGLQIFPIPYIKNFINADQIGLDYIKYAIEYLMELHKIRNSLSKIELLDDTKRVILDIFITLHLYLITIEFEDIRKDLQITILKLTEIFPPLDKNTVTETLHYNIDNKKLYDSHNFLNYLEHIYKNSKDYFLNWYKASIWLSLIISEIVENNDIKRVIELLRDIFSHEHINEIILTPELNESIRNAINYLIKQKEETTNEHIKEEIDNIVKLIEERLNYPMEKLVPVAVEQ